MSSSQAYGFYVGLDTIDVDISKEIDQINDEIERSFKNFWGPSKPSPAITKKAPQHNQASSLEQFWKKSQAKLHSMAKKLEQTAATMTDPHQQTRSISPKSYFDRLKATGKSALQELNKTEKKLRALRVDIQSRLKEVDDVKVYDVKEEATKQGYNVRIGLPGFKQEDIKVTLEENVKAQHKKLLVNATKDQNSSKGVKNTDGTVSSWHSESFSSARYINGRQITLEYNNGKLKVYVELPKDIKDQDYTMRLEKDVLIVSFPTKDATTEGTRRLHFEDGKKAKKEEPTHKWK